MILTIIIPVYNEIKTIKQIIEKIISINDIEKQIILVDDCSSDGTSDLIKKELSILVNKVIFHEKNLGKGAAIISAMRHIEGDIVIIQDADLEYDPNDYKSIIDPIIQHKAEIVYGSRVLGKLRYSQGNFTSNFRVFCNHLLTIITNILYNQKLTDAHTCYKAFKKNIFLDIDLKEKDFAFCPEVTAKVSKKGFKIFEVPINYFGRTYDQGKKISFLDGFRAIIVLLKYRIFS